MLQNPPRDFVLRIRNHLKASNMPGTGWKALHTLSYLLFRETLFVADKVIDWDHVPAPGVGWEKKLLRGLEVKGPPLLREKHKYRWFLPPPEVSVSAHNSGHSYSSHEVKRNPCLKWKLTQWGWQNREVYRNQVLSFKGHKPIHQLRLI